MGLSLLPWPSGGKSVWKPVVAFVLFLAYSIYIWLAHDEGAAARVPWWEMILLGGACGFAIGYLLGGSMLGAAAGGAIGLVLGLFADKWTGFVKHL